MRRLGPSAWRWPHQGAHVIFWLVVGHVGYFLFLHYTVSFHREVPPPDWFRWPFLALAATLVALQAAAYVRTVRRDRVVAAARGDQGRRRPDRSAATTGGPP